MEIQLWRALRVNGFQSETKTTLDPVRASRASFEDVKRLTTPSIGYFIRRGRRARRLKPRDLNGQAISGQKSERYQTLCKILGRHAITLLLFLALIVVGIVAYCARQQWWELYMSLTH
jgi:hypothetical protein